MCMFQGIIQKQFVCGIAEYMCALSVSDLLSLLHVCFKALYRGSSSVVLQNTCVLSLSQICSVEGMNLCVCFNALYRRSSSVVLQNACFLSD